MRAQLLTAAMLVLAGGVRVGAQGYVVRGEVRDRSGNPISGAEVAAIESDSATRLIHTDSAGRFELTRLHRGALTLHVRRLGYQPRDVEARAADAKQAPSTVITLDEAAASLDPMSVNGSADDPDTRLRDFYARKATNSFGHYIDGNTIRKRHPQFLSDVLRTVPGVRVSSSHHIGNVVNVRGCAPLVWVDGVRLPGAQLDDVVQPDEVAGVEIYESFAGVPAQFFDRSAACGTILVWSRAK